MRRSHRSLKAVAVTMAAVFGFLAVFVAPVQAAMVGTADILQSRDYDLARQKVKTFLNREDVTRQLSVWGVDRTEALARVNAMTDEEAALMADKIDQLPAGGDVFVFLLALAVVTFVVLVVLDIAGVTDIFTFIKKR